ncbi:hypothetical protein GBF38_011009 [Nibea albiflora]|uniref:Uncharacterized protein n=1 Tax=Nibea albiflora TaxID=240163 RepID=A0ACB7ET46_NIBAL|nr:hypothetical protein GBF38_011009 [Nibea albiflora]
MRERRQRKGSGETNNRWMGDTQTNMNNKCGEKSQITEFKVKPRSCRQTNERPVRRKQQVLFEKVLSTPSDANESKRSAGVPFTIPVAVTIDHKPNTSL